MLLTELKQKEKKGTYSGVKFDNKTTNAILKYIKDNKIPKGLPSEKMHSTVLYSRKFLPNYKPAGDYDKALEGTPTDFDVWSSNNEDGSSTNCLILKYDCDDLVKRHKELMDTHNATYDFPTYDPHITLSYDIGDLDINQLPDIKDLLPIINITHEYGENLDLSWAQNKGIT